MSQSSVVDAETAGSKHPYIFGKTGSVAWAEVWSDIGPLSETVMKGQTVHRLDGMLHRHLSALVIHLCRSLVLQQPDGVKLTAGAIPVVDICEALKEAQENVI